MNRLVALLLLAGSLGLGMVLGQSALADEKCVPGMGIQMSGASEAPWAIQIQFSPKVVPLNTPFDADVAICSQSEQPPTRIKVDATMPAHKHGMNYEPKTAKMGNNRYAVKNLLFHMPGVWRFEVTAYEKDKPHRFTYDVKVK